MLNEYIFPLDALMFIKGHGRRCEAATSLGFRCSCSFFGKSAKQRLTPPLRICSPPTFLDHHRLRINTIKFTTPATFTGKISRLSSTFGLRGMYKTFSSC